MKICRNGNQEWIETGIIDITNNKVAVVNMKGLGACDIALDCEGGITWDQLDQLKEAIALAEKEWRVK
jgi:hypothetical protein